MTEEDQKVDLYGVGPFYASACAPADMDGDEVAAEANRIKPCGPGLAWIVSPDESFATGQKNPSPCDAHPNFTHWLLEKRPMMEDADEELAEKRVPALAGA